MVLGVGQERLASYFLILLVLGPPVLAVQVLKQIIKVIRRIPPHSW